VGFVVDKVALGRFSLSTSVSPANIIPPLLHIHLSPPHEVCDCSDQAAHYHNLGPKLGASLLTRHIGWKQKKKVKKMINILKTGVDRNPLMSKLQRMVTIPRKLNMVHLQHHLVSEPQLNKEAHITNGSDGAESKLRKLCGVSCV
jgi:hypothetical protein